MKDPEAFIGYYTHSLCTIVQELPQRPLCEVLQCLAKAYLEGHKVFIAGNGGSAATASHLANDLAKTVAPRGTKGIRAVALTDNIPLITAIANDESYEEIFSRQLEVLADPGDVLIVISGSGKSPNIIQAVEAAKKMGLATIGFLGMNGGKAADLVDIPVIVPSYDYGPIEDVHMIFDHLITAYLRQSLFPAEKSTQS